MDAEFVAIALGSFPLRRQIELAIGGAEGLANNLSQANIKKLLIPKPPKTEQEAITSHIKSVSSKIEDLIIIFFPFIIIINVIIHIFNLAYVIRENYKILDMKISIDK